MQHSTQMVSFPERLRELAREAPATIAISSGGIDVTYGALWRKIESATSALSTRWRVRAGDRVAYIGLNDPAHIVLLAALMRLRAILLPLNYRLAPAELRTMLGEAEASLSIADGAFAGIAHELGAPVASRDAVLDTNVASVSADTDARTGVEDADLPALLVYTSGTTGIPKGALHTHGSLYSNVVASQTLHAFTADDAVLTVLPLFHVGGLCIQTIPALYAGARVILHPRFDAGAWLDSVDREKPTTSLMVPATMRAVQEHPHWATADLSSLRLLGAGSSTIPRPLIERFHQRGIPVCQVYGATETGPVSIVLDARDAFDRIGTAGKPAAGTTIRLLDERGGTVARDGEVGEICIRGGNVVKGYWRDPGNPAFADGWFRTGDLALRDEEGFYTIVGRAKDMIISGGENIYPAEIENALAGLDVVADVAVVGIPDRTWGEIPVAFVVPRDAVSADEAPIRAALEGTLARFKHPRRIVFRATLPRNALGKVRKSALVEELLGSTDETTAD